MQCMEVSVPESPTDHMLPFPYLHQPFLRSRLVQHVCRPDTEQATPHPGAVREMHLKLSIGNCLAELWSSGRRFLPDMLPHRPAITLLPQGHHGHSCPVRVRPASQPQHGDLALIPAVAT